MDSVFSHFGVYSISYKGMVERQQYVSLAKRYRQEARFSVVYAIIYFANHADRQRRRRLWERRSTNMYNLVLPAQARAILTSAFAAQDLAPSS